MVRLLWLLAPLAIVTTWRRSRGMGFVARTLRLGGIASLLLGVAFVQGAVEEDEPRAAAAGARTFGIIGASLVLASSVLGHRRRTAD